MDNVASGDDWRILKFTNGKPLDDKALQSFKDQLSGFTYAGKPKKIIIDFTGLEYVSSQALFCLVETNKEMAALGGKLAFTGVEDRLKELFKIANLDHHFLFYKDIATAAQALDMPAPVPSPTTTLPDVAKQAGTSRPLP